MVSTTTLSTVIGFVTFSATTAITSDVTIDVTLGDVIIDASMIVGLESRPLDFVDNECCPFAAGSRADVERGVGDLWIAWPDLAKFSHFGKN